MIPTAKEFLKQELDRVSESGEDYDVCDTMIKFAKLHRKAFEDAVVENATSFIDIDENTHVEGNVWSEVDKDSIRNAYPEELIK